MDLDAIIDGVMAPAARGRRAAQVSASVRRQVTKADVDALWQMPEGGLQSVTPPLQKLRFQHHSLARLLAEGRPQEECALITGYSSSRISILKKDPAMVELIAHYKTQTDAVYVNVHERLAALGLNTIEELMERLDVEPEAFSARELMELAELTLDRSGYGPKASLAVQHNHLHVTPDQMLRLKEEVAKRAHGTVRSLDPSSNLETPMGGAIIDGSLGEAPTTEGSSGQGDHVSECGGEGTEETIPEGSGE